MTNSVCVNHVIEKLKSSPWSPGVFLLGLLALAVLSWGCGAADQPSSTATASSGAGMKTGTVLTTVTTPSDTYPGETAVTVPAEPLSDVTPTATVATGPVELVLSDAQPASVPHGSPVTYTIKTRGAVASVTMEIKGLEMINCPLTDKTTEGDLTVWSITVPAPATPGNYRYYPTAIDTSGNRVTPPGVSAWSGYLTVT